MASAIQKGRRPEPAAAKKAASVRPQTGVRAQPDHRARICIAAWLIPGLGHWLLKKRVRALILFFAITGMFVLGVLMHGTFFAFGSPSILERLGYLGELCAGLPVPVADFFGYGGGKPFFISADYGTAYLISAGMLNLLSILDAYDISIGRKS